MRGVILWSPTLLGRGMGIGGRPNRLDSILGKTFQSAWTRRRYWGHWFDVTNPWVGLCFNPLGRGMGIGGSVHAPQKPNWVSVSIRLDAAWVLGGRDNPLIFLPS